MSEYRIEIPAAEYTVDHDRLCIHIVGVYRDLVRYLIKRAEDKGGRLRVTLDLPYRRRSQGPQSQNNHFHGHCQQIALYHGNSVEAIKDWIKRKAADEMGYPEEVMPDGRRQPKPSSEASVEECAILIECAHMVAAEECDGLVLIEGGE